MREMQGNVAEARDLSKNSSKRAATAAPSRLMGVNVFREVERGFAAGDRFQFTATNKDLGVANRDLGTVVSLEDGQMTLRMDGKSARAVTFDTAEFRQFDHDYAVTSHSSQGLTAGRVLAHIDTDSSQSLINNRLAYVAISRASGVGHHQNRRRGLPKRGFCWTGSGVFCRLWEPPGGA